MRAFGRQYDREGSVMAEYSRHLGSAIARHQTAMALNASKTEAELASKAKSEFLANMSHELRTPLNAIIGFSDMLMNLSEADLEKVNQYSNYVKQASEHLLELINGILDISKIQAGKLTVDQDFFDIHSTIESCVMLAEAKAKEKNISIDCHIEDNTPEVFADALRLKQIVINILSNAAKFSPDGSKVKLIVGPTTVGGVSIRVEDNGDGMSPQEVETAMVPFGQIDTGRNKQTEGTGLGLPITVALVRMHGGRFDISSEKGKGTHVSVTLPPGNPAKKPLKSPNQQNSEPAPTVQ